MIAYYCDRCGKAIVDGTIYRVAITAESVIWKMHRQSGKLLMVPGQNISWV